ncbi:pisatin demethylase [Phaeosphaeriaceae sp. PMI808]|nr:pisatin demethylase [Phaeosphaeriaceae sp. PMI808]
MDPSFHIPFPKFNISLYACIFFIAFAYLVLLPFARAIASPLHRVPGPFCARFTRLWEVYAVRKYDFAAHNIAMHDNYGPIVRLAPNRFSINDAEAAKVILGHHNALDKSQYYITFGSPFVSNTFSETNLAEHTKLRRPVAQLYSNTSLLSYEPFVDVCNAILVNRLKEYAVEKKELDVRELMQFYAFDVIGEITVGARFGLMEENGDKSGIIDILDEATWHSALCGLVPKLHVILGYIGRLTSYKPGFMKIDNYIDGHIQNRLSGVTKSRTDRQDFIDRMLPLEAEGKATRFHTATACMQNIAAGSDTTAISLAATIGYLTMNPPILAKLRQELDEAEGKGELSQPTAFKEAQILPYLQAVILETLRMHPAVGAPLTRIVRSGGMTFCNQFFPAGTEVGINAWVIHNNKSIFGPDAHIFRPERWFTEDKEHRALMERNMLAFGAGPRTCLGKNISLLEMKKVIPEIVRRFDFEIVQGDEYKWKTYWFSKQSFKCIVKTRN